MIRRKFNLWIAEEHIKAFEANEPDAKLVYRLERIIRDELRKSGKVPSSEENIEITEARH